MFFESLILNELESDSFLEGVLSDDEDDLALGVLEQDSTNDTPGEDQDEFLDDDMDESEEDALATESSRLFDI